MRLAEDEEPSPDQKARAKRNDDHKRKADLFTQYETTLAAAVDALAVARRTGVTATDLAAPGRLAACCESARPLEVQRWLDARTFTWCT